jgi:hypothetical protein
MSKVKSPPEKKDASLNRDCRNVYGENDKSSRKNIPRSKQRSHQAERRAVNQPLLQLSGKIDEDVANQIEAEARTRSIEQKRRGFRKSPDVPLKSVLIRKIAGKLPVA